jgi:hypothetical protein
MPNSKKKNSSLKLIWSSNLLGFSETFNSEDFFENDWDQVYSYENLQLKSDHRIIGLSNLWNLSNVINSK